MAFADRLLAAWYAGHPALALLRPLEALYRRVVTRKRARCESASYRAPVPVIVVGNITVGGTGKTPMILWLIEHCRRQGLKVGVVSRGYGAKPPQLPWRVQANQPAEHAGDEPLLIVQRSGVPLMIDPDRSRAVQALLASEPLDLILCDDGMPHYRLARDLELVLIDAARGLGNGRCLPAGPLREPAERLRDADAVLFNGCSEDRADGFGFCLRPSALVNLRSGERRGLDHFPAGQRLHRQPATFLQYLAGAKLAAGAASLCRPCAVQCRKPRLRPAAATGHDREGRGEMPGLCRRRLVVPGRRGTAYGGFQHLVRQPVATLAAQALSPFSIFGHLA